MDVTANKISLITGGWIASYAVRLNGKLAKFNCIIESLNFTLTPAINNLYSGLSLTCSVACCQELEVGGGRTWVLLLALSPACAVISASVCFREAISSSVTWS